MAYYKKIDTSTGTNYIGQIKSDDLPAHTHEKADITDYADEMVKTSADDGTAGYLSEKLVSQDESVTITDLGTQIDLSVDAGESVNIETLTADKTLTATDATVQILLTGAANRNVSLPITDLAIGQKFIIWNDNPKADIYYITVKQISTTIDIVYSQRKVDYRWNGTNWIFDNNANTAVGYGSVCYNNGSAFGAAANGSGNGAAFGVSANGSLDGAAVGGYANAASYGAALGNNATTNSKGSCTVALGINTKAERNREFVSTASETSTNKAQLTWQKYREYSFQNDSDTDIELYIDGSTARLVLINDSIYNFTGECNVIVTSAGAKKGCAKGWQFSGAIRRKNTGMVTYTENFKTVVFDDSTECPELGLIGLRLSADGTNYSLKPTITRGVGTETLTFLVSLNFRATETRA